MSRIGQRFRTRKRLLIPYVTAGFPDPEHTVAILHGMVDAGADIIELGMPFSDPMADGPVIQKACEQAIRNGVGLAQVLEMVREFRQRDTTTPLLLMGYFNPIERFGMEAFTRAASDAGVDGMLVVDVPPEESDSVSAFAEAGLDRILLATPTTGADRFAKIAENASGFIYYVSFTGITGASRLDADKVCASIDNLKQQTEVPIAVGFGIKSPADAARLASSADGVVIGSALLSHIADTADPAAAAREFLAPYREALDKQPSAVA